MKQPKDYAASTPTRTRQSFWESTIETSVNILSGFIVSYLVWIYIVPIFWPEHASSHGVAFGITVLFTVSSFLRSLFWRRIFEEEIHSLIHSFVRRYF